MKQYRDKQGRKLNRKQKRELLNKKRMEEMLRFTRNWMESHPPRFDPRCDPMKGEERRFPLGETRYIHHLAFGPHEPVPPTLAFHLRKSPSMFNERQGATIPTVMFRRVPMKWAQDATLIYFDSWEPVSSMGDETKFKEVRAAQDVVGLSRMMFETMKMIFGSNDHRILGPDIGACMEWLERLNIAARTWLGDAPMVQDKPVKQDMQRYEWWRYATEDFDQRRWL